MSVLHRSQCIEHSALSFYTSFARQCDVVLNFCFRRSNVTLYSKLCGAVCHTSYRFIVLARDVLTQKHDTVSMQNS